MDTCDAHTQLVSDIAVIKNDLTYIKDRVCIHIAEGETKGGFRDRLIVLEQSVDSLKKAEWQRVIVAGLVGGLVSQLTPEVFGWLIKMIVPH